MLIYVSSPYKYVLFVYLFGIHFWKYMSCTCIFIYISINVVFNFFNYITLDAGFIASIIALL